MINAMHHRALPGPGHSRGWTLTIGVRHLLSRGSVRTASSKGIVGARDARSTPKDQARSHALLQASDDTLKAAVVYTRFQWELPMESTATVSVWGDFNSWSKGVQLHRFGPESPAAVMLALQPGNYEFKYVVDDAWMTAPFEPTVTNSQGHFNNQRVVAATMEFRISAPDASQVLVVGDWDEWKGALLLQKDKNTGVFRGQAHLKAGEYEYHYVVDGKVALSGFEAVHHESTQKGAVHKASSYRPDVFRIFYCTGWDYTVLHYRRVAKGAQQPRQPPAKFYQQSMVKTGGRVSSLGTWKMASVVPASEGEQLEFFLTNGEQGEQLLEDKPGNAPLYCLPSPSSFKLSFGQVKPFLRGSDERIMLVSDLDGTMFGDVSSPDAFISSGRFMDYWESSQALAGSVLVYNTGRSLGQFVELMQTCGGRVAVPNALVTAVGTKVWRLETSSGRTGASGLVWLEDAEWTQQLDQHWNLATARTVAAKLIAQHNDPGLVKVLDDGSEHQHRLALCVDNTVLLGCASAMKEAFAKEGLQIRIIVSGAGSHRYMDCVPEAAGKEKALQYVRQHFGIPEHLCVAAGDSGNDILMLEGDHPGIVVGNAQPELLNWLVHQPQTGKTLYADACLADGIVEGLARHGLY